MMCKAMCSYPADIWLTHGELVTPLLKLVALAIERFHLMI